MSDTLTSVMTCIQPLSKTNYIISAASKVKTTYSSMAKYQLLAPVQRTICVFENIIIVLRYLYNITTVAAV